MNRLQFSIIIFVFIFFILNCSKTDSISNIPKIEYIGMNKTLMRQGSINEDTVWLQFKFEDGDGDLGYGSADTTHTDIILKDSRTGNIQDKFNLPDLPPSENDAQKGVITIRILTTCCIFPKTPANWQPCSAPPEFPIDSLQYLIYIIDRAGHQSNIIQSDFVKLLCQ